MHPTAGTPGGNEEGGTMDFKKLAKSVEKEVIALRRDIHAHPETPFEEVRTSRLVEKKLKSLGIKTKRMAKTGVAGYLTVPGAKRTIALRADMDALPILEEAKVPFASKNGNMHACGHDAHTAMLLGTAKALVGIKRELKVNVRFIFQPSEEFPPGGARFMVEEGVMDGVSEVYGIHVGSKIPSGKIVAEAGPQMANVDDVRVTIIGVGAHGASPNHSVDPVLTAAHAITSLQQIVSRNVSPVEPAVLSIPIVKGGDAYNIIPETCFFRGTIRTFSKKLRAEMPRMIRRVVSGECKAHGARCQMEYLHGYDALVNERKATAGVQRIATELFGKKALLFQGQRMGAEDFSEYLKVAPGCFISLGTGNAAKHTDVDHHNPRFSVDESVLWMGVALFSRIAWGGGARK
jgi:amidohydrolase